MSVGQKNIIPGVVLTASADTLYSAPDNTRVRITNATLVNDTAGAVPCTVHVVKSGEAAATKNKKISARSIDINESYTCPELIGRVLEPGDFIAASGAGVAFDVSAITQV